MYRRLLCAVALINLTACSWFIDEPSRVENPVVRGISYIGVSVSNIDESSALYKQAFDFKTVANGTFNGEAAIDALAGRTGVVATTRLLQGVNGQLRLMQFATPSQAAQQAPRFEVSGPGFAHLCMQVDHVTEAYNKFLAGEGASHIGSKEMMQLNPRNPVYYAYARDKDNVIFEIEHVDVEKLNLPKPPKNKYRLRHLAIATPDIDRTVDFYSTLFETKSPRRLGRFLPLQGEKLDNVSGYSDAKLKMAFFQVRNMEFEVAQYLTEPTEKPGQNRPIEALGHNMVVFDVTSIAAAKTKLLGAGGTVHIESMVMDGGEIMFGRDLDGNLLGFQSLAMDAQLSAQQFKDNGI